VPWENLSETPKRAVKSAAKVIIINIGDIIYIVFPKRNLLVDSSHATVFLRREGASAKGLKDPQIEKRRAFSRKPLPKKHAKKRGRCKAIPKKAIHEIDYFCHRPCSRNRLSAVYGIIYIMGHALYRVAITLFWQGRLLQCSYWQKTQSWFPKVILSI
jgi:hypothetical protein